MKYRLTTFLRPSVRDNQGAAVQKVLEQMGYNVSRLRVSKTVYFECDGRKKNLPEKIAKAIANPVMEDYTIEKL